MIILALDTSSEHGSVALARDGEVVEEGRLHGVHEHSEALFRSIEAVLRNAGTEIGQVDLFASSRGPGSFTGVRIGMAAAEGLAYATRGETAAVSTLAAFAWMAGPRPGRIVTAMDARRGEVYVASFRRSGDLLEASSAPRVERPDVFLASLDQGGEEQVVFAGPGVKHFGCRLDEGEGWKTIDVGPWLARAIVEMVGRGITEPFTPLYLRPPGNAAPVKPARRS